MRFVRKYNPTCDFSIVNEAPANEGSMTTRRRILLTIGFGSFGPVSLGQELPPAQRTNIIRSLEIQRR